MTLSVLTALSVGSTRRWLTRVLGYTAIVGIPRETIITSTIFTNISDQTLCILSTRSRFTKTEGWFRDRNTSLDGVDGFSVTWPAGAPLDIVNHHTLGVGSTRVGLALLQGPGTWYSRRITLKSRQAITDWSVSNHSTPRVWTTLVTLTLGSISDTSDKRIACLASGTGADGIAIVQLTDSSSTTGRWDTRVGGDWDGTTANICIALEAWFTGTDGVVVGKTADCVVSTESRTDRNTFSLESVAVLVFSTVIILSTF